MIVIPSTYSAVTGRYTTQDPIPSDAIALVYGDNSVTVYQTGDVIPIEVNPPSIVVRKPADTVAGKSGLVTLVAGTATVSAPSITDKSLINYSVQTAGGAQGFLRTSRVAGVGFTLTSSSATDTSVIAWEIKEPVA